MLALGLHVRAGVHTGELELRGNDVGAVAVDASGKLELYAAGWGRAGTGEPAA